MSWANQKKTWKPNKKVAVRMKTYSVPQEVHLSMKEFPCNSDSLSLGIPDRRCRPSMFCNISALRIKLESLITSGASDWMML